MKKSTFLGSAVSVLLLFSVISYSKTLFPQQNPKPNQQLVQVPAQTSTDTVVTRDAGPLTASTERPREVTPTTMAVEEKAIASQTYTATAYILHGRTATGVAVARGMIAPAPRVMPLGSRVGSEAGSDRVVYVVTDDRGSVK